MDITYPGFGSIVVEGESYDTDVVIDAGRVTRRDKGPSKELKGQFGHTPLSAGEEIPWSGSQLVVGSGYSGSLPVLPEIEQEAAARGVELVVVPTADAVAILDGKDAGDVNAILHVTC